MSKMYNKRASLERFIYEQTIGPGISGYRFINLQNNKLAESNLYTKAPIKYNNEILNTMPASVYSTGILFPKDESESAEIGAVLDFNDKEEDYENDVSE